MIQFAIENILEEIECPDTPACGWEHSQTTGEQRPALLMGSRLIPLPQFMLGWIQRRFGRTA